MDALRIEVGDGLVLDAVATGPQDGDVVVLLHGFPQSGHAWRGVWPALADAGLRVVAPDLRGYSPDARPQAVEQYRMPLLVQDVLAVAEQVSDGPVHLVGHDWGAAIAWHLAARSPQRLRTLTAVSVPHPLAFAQALREDDDQRRRSQYMRDWLDPDAEQRLLDGGLERVFGGLPAGDADHYLARLREPGALTAALAYYRAQSREDLAGVGAVEVPVLHVWSDRDAALGRYGTERTAAHVSGPYRLEVLPGVSHWVPEEAPDALVALLLPHLTA